MSPEPAISASGAGRIVITDAEDVDNSSGRKP